MHLFSRFIRMKHIHFNHFLSCRIWRGLEDKMMTLGLSRVHLQRNISLSSTYDSPAFDKTRYLCASDNHAIQNSCRNYSKAAKKRKRAAYSDEDDEDESDDEDEIELDDYMDEDLEDDLKWFDDDNIAPDQYKELQIVCQSLRSDSVISKAMNMSRWETEACILQQTVSKNGKPLLKKGVVAAEGDCFDITIDTDEITKVDKVKRVRLVKVFKEKTKTGKWKLFIRVWRNAFEKERD